MNPIDLVPFAEHSQKIPKTFLAPIASKESVSSWKIVGSHFVDFSITFALTSSMTALFSHSVKTVLVTRSLRIAFEESAIAALAAPVLPLMLFSYFFFCYFMNHGQTLGMMMFKRRVELKSKSFASAARWAAHSLILCLSCGLSYFFGKEKWENIKGHDYLYQHLVSFREIQPIILLSQTDSFAEDEVVQEEWKKAA